MSKWLFFPSPAAAEGPLQTVTYDMTSGTSATVTSSGVSIIDTRSNGVTWTNGAMRLWNGSAAESATGYSETTIHPLYAFTSGTTCRDWWCLYGVSATLNGGSAIDLNASSSSGSGGGRSVAGAVQGSCQPSYLNCSINVNGGAALVSGDTVVLTITAVS